MYTYIFLAVVVYALFFLLFLIFTACNAKSFLSQKQVTGVKGLCLDFYCAWEIPSEIIYHKNDRSGTKTGSLYRKQKLKGDERILEHCYRENNPCTYT